MVHEGRTGLTKAIVTGPGQAVLFYGHHSLGEGLNLGEVRDATFMLSGVIAWVGKKAQISAKPISLGIGRQLIAQAITKGHIELPSEHGVTKVSKKAWTHLLCCLP